MDEKSLNSTGRIGSWMARDPSRIDELIQIYRRVQNDEEAARLLEKEFEKNLAELEDDEIHLSEVIWPSVVVAVKRLWLIQQSIKGNETEERDCGD